MIRVEFFYILLGLFIGFFVVYVTSPKPKIVIKYPTIDNIQNTTYIDKNGECYKYYAKEVPCSLAPASHAPTPKINNGEETETKTESDEENDNE